MGGAACSVLLRRRDGRRPRCGEEARADPAGTALRRPTWGRGASVTPCPPSSPLRRSPALNVVSRRARRCRRMPVSSSGRVRPVHGGFARSPATAACSARTRISCVRRSRPAPTAADCGACHAGTSCCRFHSAERHGPLCCSPNSRPGNHHLTARPSAVRLHQQAGSQPQLRFLGLWIRAIRERRMPRFYSVGGADGA